MRIRFWGVRGSIACPGPETVRYGGNTPCIEVRCGSHVIVFDAGTGLRALGNTLGDDDELVDIFLTHCHLDHITGLPFFAPPALPKAGASGSGPATCSRPRPLSRPSARS